MSFTGGQLKLKGGQQLEGVKKKKKKTDAAASKALVPAGEGSAASPSTAAAEAKSQRDQELQKILHGQALPENTEGDRRTDAEKRFEARQIQLEADRLKKLAGKSHRDRVKDFNDYLAKLSEHHDIPRVGPG